MKLGFIGLGKMGRPMAANLLKAGFDLTVHNRSRQVVRDLAALGAHEAHSPQEVAQAAEVILTCLPTPESVEEVYLRQDGLVAVASPGQLLVDHSTVGLSTSRRLAEAAAARGASFLDAPVSGGTAGAQNATLTIMVGGEAEAFQRAMPVFQALGKNIHHIGPSGAGAIVKLVNQLLVCINMAGVVEGMVLGAKAGADPQVVLDVLGSSFGGSAMLSRSVPLFLQRRFDPGTPINLILKDQGIIQQLAEELGVRLLMGGQAQAIFREARALGLGELDMAALVQPLERIAQVEVRGPQG
ncbi:MAG: NAD(P)-dependent oxidoreductase [Chloroflexi bacterium]|nr:NAD(P)-dependent oxidoreductase [Chloroflexota bacterium]